MISREHAVLGPVGYFILSPSADESLREIGAVRSLFEFPRSQPSAFFLSLEFFRFQEAALGGHFWVGGVFFWRRRLACTRAKAFQRLSRQDAAIACRSARRNVLWGSICLSAFYRLRNTF